MSKKLLEDESISTEEKNLPFKKIRDWMGVVILKFAPRLITGSKSKKSKTKTSKESLPVSL